MCNIPLKSYGLGATSPCWTLSKIPHSLRAVLKTVWRTTSGDKHFFAFLTACRNEAKDTPLERYRRGAYFSYLLFSLFRYGLRAVLNLVNREIVFFEFFCNFWCCFCFSFWTVCRNEAYDTRLESYGRGAIFICWNVFEIPYSL